MLDKYGHGGGRLYRTRSTGLRYRYLIADFYAGGGGDGDEGRALCDLIGRVLAAGSPPPQAADATTLEDLRLYYTRFLPPAPEVGRGGDAEAR